MKNEVILGSAYLAHVEYYTKLFAYPSVCVERYDHYMKQAYLNRCVIASADGPLALTIPTEKSDDLKCVMKDVRISDHGNWRHVHWNAFVAAYKHSSLSKNMSFCSTLTWNCVSGCAGRLTWNLA